MRAHCRRPAGVRKLILSLAMLAAPAFVSAEGFSRVSVPIPVEIDGQPVRCPLYLNLEMKAYDLPFDKFAAGQLDQRQAMFATAVQAVREGDLAKFASVWTAPNQMKIRGTSSVALVPNDAEAWMHAAKSNFDFDKLTVLAQFEVGQETMFIWDGTMANGARHRAAFYVGPDKNNETRLSAVSSATTVQSLVMNAFFAAQMDPDAYKPLPNIHLHYQYPIARAGNADSGGHPIYLEFDGSPMNFPVNDEKVKPPTPLMDFFRKATLAQQSGNDELYASSFTPKSQEKMRKWLAEMASRRKQAKSLPRPTAFPTYVKFVLNADPVFLVFQAATAGNDWMPRNLTYTYVLHKDGAFKMANFFFSGDFEDFLQDPTLFDKQFLKSASTIP
jgi:hypothetical protein